MVATLHQNASYEGFTRGKVYKLYDSYDTSTGELKFVLQDDNNNRVTMNERTFTQHFYGGYADRICKFAESCSQ